MKVRFSLFRWFMKPLSWLIKFLGWLIKPLIWLMKLTFWLAKLLFWPVKKLLFPLKHLLRPLKIIYRVIDEKIKSSIRMQLILTFIVCLMLSVLIGTATFGIMEVYTRRAYIEYTIGRLETDEAVRGIAEILEEESDSHLDEDIIQRLLDEVVEERNFKVMITDVDGKVLYKSANATMNEIDIYELIRNMNNAKNDPQNEGVPLEYSSLYPSKINGINAYVVATGVPKAKIVYKNTGTEGAVLITIVVYIGVFVMAFQFLTKKKMSYIEEIAAGLQVISTGNLDFRVARKGSDELASLADNINNMAEELKSKIEEERRAERTKNELITNISHDLRTPLTSIMGYLELIKDKKYEDQKQLEDSINIAHGKAEKLKTLIDDLFEYTKIANEGINLNTAEVNINELLEQLIEELVPAGEVNQLEFIKEMPQERILVDMDADLMVRVFENLLMNAIRYSYKPGKILINLEHQEGKVIVCIENKGDPIPSEELPNLFNRFYRLEKSRVASMGGSGLGLAIAKSIVDLHHGDIWAECEGNSIRFFVTLQKNSF
ncbi:MAG: HAMP domain-containing protein [Clostridiales bacterium]|nr:HAMP domain-containing protein [Clostridiales bacterium]